MFFVDQGSGYFVILGFLLESKIYQTDMTDWPSLLTATNHKIDKIGRGLSSQWVHSYFEKVYDGIFFNNQRQKKTYYF